MIPVLYDATEQAFTSHGLGLLSDCTDWEVLEERNGKYELRMSYPITGIHFSDIHSERIIYAKPNPYDEPQPFRIATITKPMNGICSIYARHISYDLAGVVSAPFSAVNAPDAISKLQSSLLTQTPFVFWTDSSTRGSMTNPVPASARSRLGGSEGSILDVYGGEWAFDRFQVRLYRNRGTDRGVTIRYGKNLLDLTQETKCANVLTGVLAYWYSEEEGLVQGDIVQVAGAYPVERILSLDVTDRYAEKPTTAELNAAAQRYITANRVGVPEVSITLSFAQLSASLEYANKALLDTVKLCDYVSVYFDRLGVEASAKVVSTTYDGRRNRYKTITIGEAQTTIADTIVQSGRKLAEKPSSTALQRAVDNATAQITGATGGYLRDLFNDEGQRIGDVIMDTNDIATARNVWRRNLGGFGHSSNGFNGPYGVAITQDGAIVADYITAGTLNAALAEVINLNANNINAGTLSVNRIGANTVGVDKLTGEIKTGDWILDLETGTLTIGTISADKISAGTINADNINVTNINGNNVKAGTVGSTQLGTGSVTTPKLGAGSVTYGKTGFTGTLDQVGVNKSNIEAINALFASTLACNILLVNGFIRMSNMVFGPRQVDGIWFLAKT